MEEPGSDDFVWLAVAAQQASDLDRMRDEWRVVDLTLLTGVAARSRTLSAACAIGSPANWRAARPGPGGGGARGLSLWMASVTPAITS